MRVLCLHRTLFTQYEHQNVNDIAKAGTNITVTWTVGGNSYSQSYAAADYIIFILAN